MKTRGKNQSRKSYQNLNFVPKGTVYEIAEENMVAEKLAPL